MAGSPTVARLGVMRLGCARLNFVQPWVKVFIGGSDVTSSIRTVGWTVSKTLGGDTETAGMRLHADIGNVTLGDTLEVYCGDTDTAHLLFSGNIDMAEQSFEGGDVVTMPVWDITATGAEWRFNKVLVLGHWTYITVGDLLREIQQGWLPTWDLRIDPTIEQLVIDDFSATDDDLHSVLDRIAEAVGIMWYTTATASGGHVLTFFGDANWFDPASPLANTSPAQGFVTHRGLRLRRSGGDLITRVWSQGGGSNTLVDVPSSGVNSIPVEDASWYVQPDFVVHEDYTVTPYLIANQSRFSYTGRSLEAYDGKSTSVVPRPANVPAAPACAQGTGGSIGAYTNGDLDAGTYRYRVAYVTSNGESDASSAATGTIEQIAAPVLLPDTVLQSLANTLGSLAVFGGVPTETWRMSMTYIDGRGGAPGVPGGESAESAIVDGLFVIGSNSFALWNLPVSPDARVTGRRIYFSSPIDPVRRFVLQINDNVFTPTLWYHGGFVNWWQVAPRTASGATGKMELKSVPIGPSGTTQRRVYRTVVNGSTFRLANTIADNVSVAWNDNVADSALGANLTSNAASAGPGDTSLHVVDLGQLPAAGWVKVGTNVIRYTGKSATSGTGYLTGIPTLGYGAITTAIAPEEPVLVVPSIEGVSGTFAESLRAGDAVNLLWRVDAAHLPADTSNAYGFPFESKIADGRVSSTEARRRGIAKLLLQKDPAETVTYLTQDQTALPGRTVTVDVGDLIQGSYRIQSVRVSREMAAPTNPIHLMRSVEASSSRFTFAGLMRQLRSARR